MALLLWKLFGRDAEEALIGLAEDGSDSSVRALRSIRTEVWDKTLECDEKEQVFRWATRVLYLADFSEDKRILKAWSEPNPYLGQDAQQILSIQRSARTQLTVRLQPATGAVSFAIRCDGLQELLTLSASELKQFLPSLRKARDIWKRSKGVTTPIPIDEFAFEYDRLYVRLAPVKGKWMVDCLRKRNRDRSCGVSLFFEEIPLVLEALGKPVQLEPSKFWKPTPR